MLLTSDDTFRLWLKVLIEHFVLHSDTSMWPFEMIMGKPGLQDVVKLFQAEAHEVVQDLALGRFDPGFRKCVRLWGLERDEEASHAFRFPKCPEFVGIFSVAVMNDESRLDAHVIEPHVGVAGLLHDPDGRGRRSSKEQPAS